MGMSIEEIIKYLPAPICGDTVISQEKQKEYDAHDSAVIILRKYQKIAEIVADDYGYISNLRKIMDIKEVIKGYGNDPQEKDPLRLPCDYKFYEIDGVAICEESFKKMKLLEDIAIPKDQYEQRLKADMVAMLEDLDLKIDEMYEPQFSKEGMDGFYWAQVLFKDLVQEEINALKGEEDGCNN